MVAMNTEDGGFQPSKRSFQFTIAVVPIIVCANITEDNDSVLLGKPHAIAKAAYFMFGAMGIAGIVNHLLLSFRFSFNF